MFMNLNVQDFDLLLSPISMLLLFWHQMADNLASPNVLLLYRPLLVQ